MARYAEAATLKKYVREANANSVADADINTLLDMASRIVDRKAEVDDNFFNVAGSSSSKDIIGSGTAYLQLPPYKAATAPTVTMPSGFAEPTWREQGAEGLQYLVVKSKTQRLDNDEFESWADRFEGWPDGEVIAVEAEWGFTAIPDEAAAATIQIAAHMLRTIDVSNIDAVGADVNIVQLGLPPTAKAIVDQLRMRYSRTSLAV